MSETMPTSRVAKRPDAVSLAVVLTHLALVFAPVYVTAALGGGWWILPCWLWYGLTMNGLLNLMHEAAHYHVFRARAANNFLGRWVLGPLALADFDSYRQRHWDHHRHLGDPDDPKTTYHMDIRGRRLLTLAGRCLGLIEAVRKFRHQADAHDDEPVPGQSLPWMLHVFLVQALFGGSILALAAWTHRGEPAVGTVTAAILAYGFVYIYGIASVTVFAANLRAIAEHQIGDDHANRTGLAALRNFSCNPVTRLFFGAYGFGEHATHHRLPAVPYYRLTPVTETLAAKDPAMAQVNGYVGTIISLVRQTGSSPSLLPEDPAT
jgi:fatty acid desaturase